MAFIGSLTGLGAVGTVSYSGAVSSGTPTGAVMQRGSNSNGDYIKFADGTMICHDNDYTIVYPASSWTVDTHTFTFPHNFSTADALSYTSYAGGHMAGSHYVALTTYSNDHWYGDNTSTLVIQIVDYEGGSSYNYRTCSFNAIGKWFTPA